MNPDPYIGQEIVGQFRIVQRIGKGGMGAVYKAEQPAMGRFVAVKILHRNLTGRQDLATRFRREARAMSRLTHPNTARVFLYGQLDSGALYIVMEYLEGLNLHQVTKRQGPLTLSRAASVLVQCGGALEEAHRVGIIHRDLKPENIILTEQGGMPDFAKVLDFGLAKVHEVDLNNANPLTQEGMVFGTPEFMSPEQARGKTLDGRSDLYALGIIFYELLTGRLPFEGHGSAEFIRHQIKTPPIPVSERVPGLQFPPALDSFFARALAKDREERFPHAAEFADALRPFVDDGGGVSGRHVSMGLAFSGRGEPGVGGSRALPAPAGPVYPASLGGAPVAEGVASRSFLWGIIIVLSVLVLLLGAALATLVALWG